MRRLLRLIIIVSFLALQFHGISHELQASADEKQHCPVCEVQSNNATDTCEPIVFLAAIIIDADLLLELEQIVLPPLIILNSPARAPPFIS